MADLGSITAVRITSNTITNEVTYGATISAGQSVYLDSADGEYKLAGASASASAECKGIAVTPGVDGGRGVIATGGDIILVGTTAAVGAVYVVSATAGGIAPEADLSSGEYVTVLGVASSATQLKIQLQASGVAHA